MKFEERSRQYREYIEEYLKNIYPEFRSEPQTRLFDAMEYSLLAGGKRLRPIFVLDFCRMCGGDWKKAVPFAAALEMIHTYSLIHDDLPCMDNDDFRRGRPTNHKVFGETMAILAGDALLTDAFLLASGTELPNPENMGLAIGVLAQSAGSLGMVGGQVLDIMSEQRELNEQEVIDIQTRKTGALINAACVLGTIAGGGSEEQIAAAAGFAGALGLAFQIRDDMLDVEGDAALLGKAVGADAAHEKATFPALVGMDACRERVRTLTEGAVAALSAFEGAEFLEELAVDLAQRDM